MSGLTEEQVNALPEKTVLRYGSEIWERRGELFRCLTNPFWTFAEWEELSPHSLYWYAFNMETEVSDLEVLTPAPAPAPASHVVTSVEDAPVCPTCGPLLPGTSPFGCENPSAPAPAPRGFREWSYDEQGHIIPAPRATVTRGQVIAEAEQRWPDNARYDADRIRLGRAAFAEGAAWALHLLTTSAEKDGA